MEIPRQSEAAITMTGESNGHGPVLYDLEEEEEVEMVSVTIGGRWRGGGSDVASLQMEEESLTGDRQTNERLLSTAFVSFMAFTIVQSIASYIAKSEAMMADSASMLVDSLTYLINLSAERRKSRFEEYWEGTDEQDPERRKRIKERAKRVMVLRLEIIPPVVSVVTLIGVTIVILRDSLTVIMLDAKRDASEQGDPNINLMLAFSLLNLLLDAMNMFCFARSNRQCGYATSREDKGDHQVGQQILGALSFEQKYAAIGEDDEKGGNGEEVEEVDFDIEGHSIADRVQKLKLKDDNNKENESRGHENEGGKLSTNGTDDWFGKNGSNGKVGKSLETENSVTPDVDDAIHRAPALERQPTFDSQPSCDGDGPREEANLNMCSAYTHVFADTLRSIAVVIAATTAEVADTVTSEEADATAAIVVSILILLSLIPLLNGLAQSVSELRAIHAELKLEKMFPTKSTQEIT